MKHISTPKITNKQVIIGAVIVLAALFINIAVATTHRIRLERQLQQTTQQLNATKKNLNGTAEEKAKLQKQVEDLNKQKQDLEGKLQAKIAEKQRIASIYANRASAGTIATVITGDKSAWMAAAGIPQSDWGYVDYIVSHEGGWNGTTKWNRAGSGAYGLCQALPASKMAIAGADYMTNPVTQLKWCDMYAHGAHGGTWESNYNFWLNNHWW